MTVLNRFVISSVFTCIGALGTCPVCPLVKTVLFVITDANRQAIAVFSYKYQLSQTNPRDALPHAHCAVDRAGRSV